MLFSISLYTHNFGISQVFTDNFSTIVNRNCEALPVTGSAVGCNQYMGSCLHPSSFFLSSVTSADVERVIMPVKNKKAPFTMYSIQSLKYIISLISPILCCLINKFFSFGQFPDSFKTVRVIPIYKSGEKHYPDNYRPI